MNSETFDGVLSKVCGFATLVAAGAPPPTPLPPVLLMLQSASKVAV